MDKGKIDYCKEMRKRIKEECKLQGINNKAQIDYITATAMWETNHTCLPVKEAYWLSEAWRKRHLRYYPYYGRGYVQLTWKYNYEKFQKLLDIPLVEHPELALDPEVATKILVTGMKDGIFTGYNLNRFFPEDKPADFVHARLIINGTDKAEVIASMAKNIHYA